MRSTILCTPILINDSMYKTVATDILLHMSKSISSIPALISVAIRRDQYIIHVNIDHCN